MIQTCLHSLRTWRQWSYFQSIRISLKGTCVHVLVYGLKLHSLNLIRWAAIMPSIFTLKISLTLNCQPAYFHIIGICLLLRNCNHAFSKLNYTSLYIWCQNRLKTFICIFIALQYFNNGKMSMFSQPLLSCQLGSKMCYFFLQKCGLNICHTNVDLLLFYMLHIKMTLLKLFTHWLTSTFKISTQKYLRIWKGWEFGNLKFWFLRRGHL